MQIKDTRWVLEQWVLAICSQLDWLVKIWLGAFDMCFDTMLSRVGIEGISILKRLVPSCVLDGWDSYQIKKKKGKKHLRRTEI